MPTFAPTPSVLIFVSPAYVKGIMLRHAQHTPATPAQGQGSKWRFMPRLLPCPRQGSAPLARVAARKHGVAALHAAAVAHELVKVLGLANQGHGAVLLAAHLGAMQASVKTGPGQWDEEVRAQLRPLAP